MVVVWYALFILHRCDKASRNYVSVRLSLGEWLKPGLGVGVQTTARVGTGGAKFLAKVAQFVLYLTVV